MSPKAPLRFSQHVATLDSRPLRTSYRDWITVLQLQGSGKGGVRTWLGLGGGVGFGRLEFCWALGFRVQSLEVSGIRV